MDRGRRGEATLLFRPEFMRFENFEGDIALEPIRRF
jgi:hypothetical protein